MIRLYDCGGAKDFETLGFVYSDEEWSNKKSFIIKLLNARRKGAAATLFERFNFHFYEAVNGFNDEFNVLLAKVPINEYIDVEENLNDIRHQKDWIEVAKASSEIAGYTRFIAVELCENEEVKPVKSPEPKITSEVVERALNDAENLIKSSGPSSAIDRIHTAIHGYLKVLCTDSNIIFNENTNLITFWGLLRQNHNSFKINSYYSDEITKILRSISNILDALNDLRNKASIAHPNENIIKDEEAMLVINSIRSVLHYLDAKVR